MSAVRAARTPAAAAGTISIGDDLRVNRMGFGALRLTGRGVWGPPADRPEAIRVLRRAIELGVNFIDTADSYGPNVSEELIAEALHPYPEGLAVLGACSWSGSISTSCIGSTRQFRPTSSSVPCGISSERARCATSDCPRYRATTSNAPGGCSLSCRCRIAITSRIVSGRTSY